MKFWERKGYKYGEFLPTRNRMLIIFFISTEASKWEGVKQEGVEGLVERYDICGHQSKEERAFIEDPSERA
jgi:hypothetical protein